MLSRNGIMTTTKGHKHVVNLRKLKSNNPNVALIKVNAYARVRLIPSIRFQDIKQKRNSDGNKGQLL